jgi:hypothetical protein
MAHVPAWLSQSDENLLPPDNKSVIWPRPDRFHIADFATFSGSEQLPPDLEAFVELVKEDAKGRGIITEVDRVE